MSDHCTYVCFHFAQLGYATVNMACDNLHVECAKLLLAIPGIDVNVQSEVTCTVSPLYSLWVAVVVFLASAFILLIFVRFRSETPL